MTSSGEWKGPDCRPDYSPRAMLLLSIRDWDETILNLIPDMLSNHLSEHEGACGRKERVF